MHKCFKINDMAKNGAGAVKDNCGNGMGFTAIEEKFLAEEYLLYRANAQNFVDHLLEW